MNTLCLNAQVYDTKGQTILFHTNIDKAHTVIPRTIKWDQVTLSEKWTLQVEVPAKPCQNQNLQQIIEYEDGDVEIQFTSFRKTRLKISEGEGSAPRPSVAS